MQDERHDKLDPILNTLNSVFPEVKPFTGFFIIAHNDDGAQTIIHKLSTVELVASQVFVNKAVSEVLAEDDVPAEIVQAITQSVLATTGA